MRKLRLMVPELTSEEGGQDQFCTTPSPAVPSPSATPPALNEESDCCRGPLCRPAGGEPQPPPAPDRPPRRSSGAESGPGPRFSCSQTLDRLTGSVDDRDPGMPKQSQGEPRCGVHSSLRALGNVADRIICLSSFYGLTS